MVTEYLPYSSECRRDQNACRPRRPVGHETASVRYDACARQDHESSRLCRGGVVALLEVTRATMSDSPSHPVQTILLEPIHAGSGTASRGGMQVFD